jgi:hypothetical protein
VLTHKSGIPLSCLLFSNNSPVVVCGGADGKVTVLRTFNIDREYETNEEQLGRLDQVISDNVMKKGGAQEGAAVH